MCVYVYICACECQCCRWPKASHPLGAGVTSCESKFHPALSTTTGDVNSGAELDCVHPNMVGNWLLGGTLRDTALLVGKHCLG